MEMRQHVPNHRNLLVLLLLVVSVAIALYIGQQRKQQAAGYCEETGQRLSDTQILQKAESYVASWAAAAQGTGQFQDGPTIVRIVPEAALRAEDQVPAWVKNTGGFRAYVEVVHAQGYPRNPFGRPDLIVVSNCGKFRLAYYEYFGGWLW